VRYLLDYLYQVRKPLIFYILSCIIFGIIFELSQADTITVLYAALLCAVIGLVAVAFDFAKYVQRRRQLKENLNAVLLAGSFMSEPLNAVEADYQELVHGVLAEYARVVAAEASRRSDFLDYYSTWVHQVKSPIAAMRLFLDSGKADPEALAPELFRVEQYVDMALQYARLENISADLVFREIDLAALVRQSVRKFAPVFIGRRLGVKIDDFDLKPVTDEKWVAVVLDQIFSNALKYTPSGHIEILRDPAVECGLIIRDTGIGIRPEDIPRVFERGFTGVNGRLDKRATGLGLYLAKKVMDRLSHAIRIESDGKTGTSVYLDFSQNLTKMKDTGME